MQMTYLLLGLVALWFLSRKKSAVPKPSADQASAATVDDFITGIIKLGRDSAAIVNYGTSQGKPEGQVFPSADPGDNTSANPDQVGKASRSSRRVTAGAEMLNTRVTRKVMPAPTISIKPRQGMKKSKLPWKGSRPEIDLTQPYHPFQRMPTVQLIRAVQGQ